MMVMGVEIIYLIENYLIILKEYGVDFLMDYCYLWLCFMKQCVVMVICVEIICVVQQFFDGNGFIQVDFLILIFLFVEGIINLFYIKYFDEDVYFI